MALYYYYYCYYYYYYYDYYYYYYAGSSREQQAAGSTRVVAAALAHQQEKGLVACPSFTAMVFWCGGGLFSAPEAVQREKVGKIGKRLFLILAKDYF